MNNFVTAQLIAERALPHLAERTKFLPNITFGVYDGTFKKQGATIQIRKPQRATVVDGSASLVGNYSDMGDTEVDLTLSHQATVAYNATQFEQVTNIDDLDRLMVIPAVNALAADIDKKIQQLYKDIPYYSGVSGTTPSTLAAIANARKVLQDNLAPLDNRAFVYDSEAEAAFLALDSFAELDKSGLSATLRQAAIGRVYDMLMFSDSQIVAHTAGLYTALTDITITTGAADATSIELTSAAGTSTATILEGDIFTLDSKQYVVTATTAAASSGVVTAAIYPALEKAFGDMTTVTVEFADETALAHVPNLMFQKDAFAFATVPMGKPAGAADFAQISMNGWNISIKSGYDVVTGTSVWRFDVLYGVVTTYPELAVRVLG